MTDWCLSICDKHEWSWIVVKICQHEEWWCGYLYKRNCLSFYGQSQQHLRGGLLERQVRFGRLVVQALVHVSNHFRSIVANIAFKQLKLKDAQPQRN